MKQLLIEVDEDTFKKLEGIAPARSRRRSAFIRAAISILAPGKRSRPQIAAGGGGETIRNLVGNLLRSSREIEVKRSLGHALGWAELSVLR